MRTLVSLSVVCALGAAPHAWAEPAATSRTGAPTPAASASSSSPARQRPKLLVLQLTGGGGIDPDVVSAFTESVTAEVAARGIFDVVSTQEVQTVVGVERQRQLMGCSDDAQSCLAELAGALGAEFVLSGSLARIGESYQLSLQTLDSRKAQPIGRAVRIADSLDALRAQLPYPVSEATATPLPPPPSRWLSYGLWTGGAALTVGGGLFVFQSASRTAAINRELENGEQNPSALQPLQSYREERSSISKQRTLGLVGLGLGAAAVGLGFYFLPTDPLAPVRGPKLSFVPASEGLGLGFAGVMP